MCICIHLYILGVTRYSFIFPFIFLFLFVSEHVYILLCRYAVPNLVHINIAHGVIRRRVCLGAEIHERHIIYFSGK